MVALLSAQFVEHLTLRRLSSKAQAQVEKMCFLKCHVSRDCKVTKHWQHIFEQTSEYRSLYNVRHLGKVFYRCLGFQCKYLTTCAGLSAENAEQMLQPRVRRSTHNHDWLINAFRWSHEAKQEKKKQIAAACDECFLSFRPNLHKLVPTTMTTKASPGAETAAVGDSVLNTENNSVQEVLHGFKTQVRWTNGACYGCIRCAKRHCAHISLAKGKPSSEIQGADVNSSELAVNRPHIFIVRSHFLTVGTMEVFFSFFLDLKQVSFRDATL